MNETNITSLESKYDNSLSKLLQERILFLLFILVLTSLQGVSPGPVYSKSPEQFWSGLLSLEFDRKFLAEKLAQTTKEACLTTAKVLGNVSLSVFPGADHPVQ
jgi:hypothetical protein